MKTRWILIIAAAVIICLIVITSSAFSIIVNSIDYPYYKLELVNRTPYQLDSIYLPIEMDRNFSLAPNQRSDEFIFEEDWTTGLVAAPEITVFVIQYSDADSTYKHSIGSSLLLRDFRAGELNRVVITYTEPNEIYSHKHFKISLEHQNSEATMPEAESETLARKD